MFLHDAQDRTESWKRRHSPEAIAIYGAWRWKGIQDNASAIFNEFHGNLIMDFGGKDGPIGFGSWVCDKEDDPENFFPDVIFSSHTIEHISDASGIIKDFYRWLGKEGGCLILHVPAYTCERWRAGSYHNEKQSDHLHTFCLSQDAETGFECIDRMVAEAGFDIEKAEYVGDDSILIIARRRA